MVGLPDHRHKARRDCLAWSRHPYAGRRVGSPNARTQRFGLIEIHGIDSKRSEATRRLPRVALRHSVQDVVVIGFSLKGLLGIAE